MSSHKWKVVKNNVLKIVAVLLLGILTTCALMLSKGSTLFIVSQIRTTRTSDASRHCFDLSCESMTGKVEEEDASSAWMWNLLMALIFPDILTFLQSGLMILTLGPSRPNLVNFILLALLKVLQTIGMCLLFFVAFPEMSSVEAAVVTASVGWFPGLFKCFNKQKKVWKKVPDILAVICQLGTAVSWIIFRTSHSQIWSLPVGLLLTSFGWWAAWVPQSDGPCGLFKKVRSMKVEYKKQINSRHLSNLIVSLLKIGTVFAFFFVYSESQSLLSSYKMKATYETKLQTVMKPGHPPEIPINETTPYDNGFICKPPQSMLYTEGQASLSSDQSIRATANVADPDEEDCTAYWSRDCAETTPSLTYTVCPSGEAFGFNTSNYQCINSNSCCKPLNETNCGGNCLNMDNIELRFQFPNESAEFTDENGSYDWSIVLDESVFHVYPLAALAVQIVSTYLAYWLCYFACQSQVQRIGFALPVTLSQILVLVPLIMMCSAFRQDPCVYTDAFPSGLFFNCEDESFTSFVENNWLFILAFLSQVWITFQIWISKSERLAQVDDIFVGPFYESLLIEQSLIFQLDQNREKVPKEEKGKGKARIVGCATMWHETQEEMEILLQSVLDMDRIDKEDYTWKMRIFFDDAFKENGFVNSYVFKLFDAMDNVHKQRNIDIPIPILEDTPYGGNITWKLNKESKLVCHLKDKKKIRHKKRWSQCMYFEYFKQKSEGGGNAFGIAQAAKRMVGKPKDENEYVAGNTFILALDGDVDFKPDAVDKLFDVMKKNDDIGAACGRIHPTGSGMIPGYQKFEYAVGHWLQKSTEDALGNVLCSPGCFSLFRLKAVIQNNLKGRNNSGGSSTEGGAEVDKFSRKAMKKKEKNEDLDNSSLGKYFTKSETALNCIQYDQGEDRWLCTLLIARGWEVEYVASSHSYTACPETFDEFYNQRRRWSPSTVANLLDLLKKWRILIRYGNGNVVHMLYQVLTISASAIGPGGIFLMLVGGCHMVFEMGYWISLSLNAFLIFIFLAVSIFDKKVPIIGYPLLVAKTLSIIYGILMLIIMVLLIIEAIRLRQHCSLAPSTFSLILVSSAFLVSGLLHGREFLDLRYGLIYYLTIPSMYMLLPFYCVFNLNDVSWGTRETTEEGGEKEEKQIETEGTVSGEPKKQLPASKNWKKDISDIRGTEKNQEETKQSETEEKIWKKVTNKLEPLKQSDAQKKTIEKGLENLRTETFLFFLFVNVAFVFIVFLMQLRFEEFDRFSVDWPLCKISTPLINDTTTTTTISGTTTTTAILFETYNTRSDPSDLTENDIKYFTLDPINLVFMAFFLGVMLFQVIGLIFHRIRTVGHILSRTEWGAGKKEGQKEEQVDSGMSFDVYKGNQPGTNVDAYKSRVPNKNVQKVEFTENRNTYDKSNNANSFVNLNEITTDSTQNNDFTSNKTHSYVNMDEVTTESTQNVDNSSSSSSSSEDEDETQNRSQNTKQHLYMSSESINHIYTNPTVVNYTSETIVHL